MKKHAEIKGWSTSRELRSALPPETMKVLKSLSVEEVRRMYREILLTNGRNSRGHVKSDFKV